MRCDGCNNYWGWSGKFQSTHLHEVWLLNLFFKYLILKFQSTHLHEVWLRDVILHKKGNVSIHTPTWGVTPKVKCTLDLSEVSIHTPTWGVTHLDYRSVERFPKFQSTHLHEVWQYVPRDVSVKVRFQSTHLHEVWPWYELSCEFESGFNPHTYMRCD